MSLTAVNNQLEPSTIVLDNDSDYQSDIQEEPQSNKTEPTSAAANEAAAVRNGINGDMQRFMLQQKVATAPTKATQSNSENEQINIDVLIPKGRTDLTDAEWRQGAAKGYYQQKGLQFSQAAIEEAASFLYAVEKGKPDFVRDSSGKIIRDLNNEPIPAYHITFTPRGGTIRSDYIASEAKEARELLDSFIPQAQAITAAGTPAVAGTDLEQRLVRVKEIYQQKYGDITTQQALDQIFSVKNLTMLGITEVGMKTAAAPVVAGFGAAKMTVIDAPKFYLEGVEIKKLIYGAQKPSDLEKAAEKFAGLVKEGKVMVGTSIIGAAGKGIIAGIDRIPAIKFPDITPTGKAVVTEGGAPINWRMPIEPTPSPAVPLGGLVKGVAIEAGKGAIGGLATNISPRENFGGPAGRPDALEISRRKNDIGGSRPPVEGRGIPLSGKHAPKWGNAPETGGLKKHAAKHGEGIIPSEPNAYYAQAVNNMNHGHKFTYWHRGQIKNGYLQDLGNGKYLFTGTSLNNKTIFTHFIFKRNDLINHGITLRKE